ncbi:MAG: cold-shock protein, partial [Cucumibacter sp.]
MTMGAKLTTEPDEPVPGNRDLGLESGAPAVEGEGQQDLPLDVIEISGAIKWFDVAKGFGFIVP